MLHPSPPFAYPTSPIPNIARAQGIQMQTKKSLCAIKGISEAKIEKIREAARKITVREAAVARIQ